MDGEVHNPPFAAAFSVGSSDIGYKFLRLYFASGAGGQTAHQFLAAGSGLGFLKDVVRAGEQAIVRARIPSPESSLEWLVTNYVIMYVGFVVGYVSQPV